MPSLDPTATPFNLTSIKFGISPSECGCDDCKAHLLKSIVFGQIPNDYVCPTDNSESLVDNPEPASSCIGEPEAEVYRCPRYKRTARSKSAPTLSTIPEEAEDVSSSEEQDSSSSCGVSSTGMFEPNFASQCPGVFMHEVSSWSPETCYSDAIYNSRAEEDVFHHHYSQPFGPCDIPHHDFEIQAPQYCQPEQFTHTHFDDMPDVQYYQPEQFPQAHFKDVPQPQYYQSEFTHPPFNESSIPDHYFGTPFKPYYKFDYAQYNSRNAQSQYPFPFQGPAQFILDYPMFGEKSVDVSSEAAPVQNVPVEYVGYSVDEREDWVYVDRNMDP